MPKKISSGLGLLLTVGSLASACSSDTAGTPTVNDGAGGGGASGAGGTSTGNGGHAGSTGANGGRASGASGGAAQGGNGGVSTAGRAGSGGSLPIEGGSGGNPTSEAGAAGAISEAGAAGAGAVVNIAPFVDPIPDVGIVFGQPLSPVSVHLSDDLTPTAYLVVTAVSDNPALLKSANIGIFNGVTPDFRTLGLALESGQLGTANITVTALDGGGLTRSRSFKLSVLAAAANQTELVSRSSSPDSVLGNGFSSHPSLSADGRLVAFASASNNLTPGDLGTNQDIFVYDRQTQLVKRLTKNTGNSTEPVISADGKHVAFTSDATNLVANDTNGNPDVFVYDLPTDTIERVSVADSEAQADGASQTPDLSADGNLVLWASAGTNLVAADTNGKTDIFVRNRTAQTTVRVSVSSTGVESDHDSIEPQISDDGSVVAFQSQGTKLIDGHTDPDTSDDIFVRSAGITRRISRNPSLAVDANGYSERPALSGDGKFAAFASFATNLVTGDDNAKMDVFVYDLVQDKLERVSVTSAGDQSDGLSSGPSLNVDGSRVVFDSLALDLAGANTGYINCYLFDRSSKKVFLMNGSDFGGFANASTNYRSVISNDGKLVAFHSAASNLVVGDDNGYGDIFVAPYSP